MKLCGGIRASLAVLLGVMLGAPLLFQDVKGKMGGWICLLFVFAAICLVNGKPIVTGDASRKNVVRDPQSTLSCSFIHQLFKGRYSSTLRANKLMAHSDCEINTTRNNSSLRVVKMRHSRHNPDSNITTVFAPAGSAKLTVKDNHKPLFVNCSNYKPVVREEQAVGTYIFTVVAEDRDPKNDGGTVVYKFVNTPGEKERFRVDPDTGQIYTNDVFDHDEPSREKEAYITVRASDNGHPQLNDACTIRIIIEDINDNQPVFDKVSYSESVPQDLPVDREVMRISATDIDDGNNSVVHYSLDSNSPDRAYFRIDPDNGVIFLNKNIDKTPGYRFRLSAIVKDQGDPSLQSSINLDIQVVESNKKSPSFVEYPDDPIVLKENFSNFTVPIAVVRAVSNIPDETNLQFELVQGQTEQTNKLHTFVLEPDGDAAYIKLGNHLDYEKITEYTITVRIQNNFRLAAETIVDIKVEDVNDNIPIFSEIGPGSVLENEPAGTQVMQVRAFDNDGTAPNNEVTYALADGTDSFTIDPITGNITTLKMFDREEKSFYNIKVSATDNAESALIPGKHNSGQQVFQIEIADKNDNSPHFTQDTYVAESIAENANINELVTQVTAIDSDAAAVITYSIVSGNINNAFVIKNLTGEIRVNGNLDYEEITSYSLDVRASDGVYEDFAKVIIKLENLNDNPPVFFEKYKKVLMEETLVEGCVLTVEAYDPDIKDRKAPQHIKYSLIKSEQAEYFSIDDTGCLRLLKPLNRDPPNGYSSYQIIIMASDHSALKGSESLRATTEVILNLNDINDNPPILSNLQPVLWYENTPPGQVVKLLAKDVDSPQNGAPFTFEIAQNASYEIEKKFRIVDDYLETVVVFDREEKKEYEIPILITDSGSPRMSGVSYLRLIIGDRNDNPMKAGHSNIFVYNFKLEMDGNKTVYTDGTNETVYTDGTNETITMDGNKTITMDGNKTSQTPDTEIGRVYVIDPDDWDLPDKTFSWYPTYEERIEGFDISSKTGMITMAEGKVSAGTYELTINVTEKRPPVIPFHWVLATVTVVVKDIPEEAVDKSGSIRFLKATEADFILPESDGTSKREKLVKRLGKLYNTSEDNVDVFTVRSKVTVDVAYLDVRFSAHGSPYYYPQKLNSMATTIQDELEEMLQLQIYMININECLVEKEQCDGSCRNLLIKQQVPHVIYTNTTSFIGVGSYIEPQCNCDYLTNSLFCMNGGTLFSGKCECPVGTTGPKCEQTTIGFAGDGWAMYSPPPTCEEGRLALALVAHCKNCLVFYLGPQRLNRLLPIRDFVSLELFDGYAVLMFNYGSGTSRINNSAVYVADGQPHFIEVFITRTSVEMFVDKCRLSKCMSLGAPVAPNDIINFNGPLHLGGTEFNMEHVAASFEWNHKPSNNNFVGCIRNLTYNEVIYDLGKPEDSKNADPSCTRSSPTAATFGVDNKFLIVILVCLLGLVVLLLAVVVHRKKSDSWAEKEMDDIRENIIAYEDEGGGAAAAPNISGFLDDKKSVLDRDPEANPFDDVRHYAYEGDGMSTGSLSSLASCTADGDLEFAYLASFGPRFRKLADMYGDSDEEDAVPHEESWC